MTESKGQEIGIRKEGRAEGRRLEGEKVRR
jgi:hypothetical protein